jgi:hypothetical protein
MDHEELVDVLALVGLALTHGAPSRLELLVLGRLHVTVPKEQHALEVPVDVTLAEHLGALVPHESIPPEHSESFVT